MQNCPTCGAALEGRAICPNCGTIGLVELKVAEARGRLHDLVFNSYAVPKRIEFRHLLWLCALTPLLLIPPAFALSCCLWSLAQGNDRPESHIEWIGLISAINLIVSVIVLQELGGALFDVIRQIPPDIPGWLGDLFGIPTAEPDTGLAA